jgi:MFS family permease
MEENTQARKPEPSVFYRWTILVLVSIGIFGNYYIYDSISPLADVLSRQLNFSDSDIGLLNAIYHFPNIIMVFIGGILIDRLGTRISTFLFTLACLIGAIVTSLSGDLYVMSAGRLIFGLGAESMIVAVTTILGRWFKGKELSFAFGMNLTLARLGTVAALNSPTWAEGLYETWQGPLLITVAAGFVSVVVILFYWYMDVYATKNYSIRPVPKQDEFNLKESFTFPTSYWYIVLLCVTFYSAVFPFKTFAVKFFIIDHGTTREFGGFLSSLLDLSAMFLTPLFGLLADYKGKRSLLMMFGSFVLLPVYLLMAYTHINLVIPMAIMGISFSLIPAVIWPSVAIIVEERKLGTAFGLMTMIQNIGLTAFNYIIGMANDLSGGYTAGMWIFSSLGFFGLLFAYLLRRSELGENGHGLEKGFKET